MKSGKQSGPLWPTLLCRRARALARAPTPPPTLTPTLPP